jgi:hypothetical protein
MLFDDLKSDFFVPPEGAHVGVLVSWIDRGVQSGKYGPSRQVGLKFELPLVETPDASAPCLLFTTVFNCSMRSKKFREMATAIMGKPDLHGASVREMIGKNVKLSVIHNEGDDGTVYANIATYRPVAPGAIPVSAESPCIFFSLDPADVDGLKPFQKDFEALPESERIKISASPTFQELLATLKHTQASKGKKAKDIIGDNIPGEDDDKKGKPFDDGFPDEMGGEPKAA